MCIFSDAAGFSTRDSINYQILKALWPDARLMFKRNIERAIRSKSMILEHALTSDRGGCHRNPRTLQWGKMNAGHMEECKEFLPSLRNKILRAFNLTKNTSAISIVEKTFEKKQNVYNVYNKICPMATISGTSDDLMLSLSKLPIPLLFIDRGEVNTLPPWNVSDPNITKADIMERKRIEEEGRTKARRDLTQNIKDEMILQLRSKNIYIGRSSGSGRHNVDMELPSGCKNEDVVSMPLFNVSVATLQGRSFKEQVSLLTQTKIVLSMHGNGLTHLLWISPERTGEELLVEIFPHGAFTLDYQLQATISGINHFAFDAQDGLINGSTDTVEGTGCYDKIKPYDASNNLNSVVEYLNIPLLIQQLSEATMSLLKTGIFPPPRWKQFSCSKLFDLKRQDEIEEDEASKDIEFTDESGNEDASGDEEEVEGEETD